MSHNIEIKDGAFVIADAHYSNFRPSFLEFLKKIHLKELKPTQLIFLGDIFDALFGEVSYTQVINQEAIKLINEISLEMEVIYLEGNHDFNLKDIFPYAKVFPISQQPLTCRFRDKKVMLAHGDFFNKNSDLSYIIYTKIIRNPVMLFILSTVDTLFGHIILKKLDEYLRKKDDCKKFVGFEEFITKRIDENYDCDYFIEGHFHQNKSIKLKNFLYINLGIFACNQRYFIVKFSQELGLLEENIFSKEK